MARGIFSIIAILLMLTQASQLASAQIEKLVMPGDVIEGHAEIEAECDNCHAKFDRSQQRTLCLDCHADIASDVEIRTGYHGLFGDARETDCAGCHTDHEGRDAKIVLLDEASFDHDYTDFLLHGLHIEAACVDCHEPGDKHRNAPSECHVCHEADSVHEGFLGDECADCHAPTGWTDVEFDHETTGYSLLGGHGEAACLDCHADQTFQPAPTTCFDCHADDDVHEGRSGPECGNCHSPTGWGDTTFDHARDTRFPLDGRHARLSCDDCHSDEPFADSLDTSCFSCHAEDDNHKGHLGAQCDSCHATSDWADSGFDHATDAGYELHFKHATIECEACHVEPVFEVALATGCNNCHADDDPHAGTQGESCTDCHSESAWDDDLFFDHDMTRFPLLGSHSALECEDCHETRVFTDASESCVDCHADADPHADRFCKNCHNPVEWRAWRFDHDQQTEFPLSGAHVGVECDACHRKPLAAQLRIGNRCADCHRNDDIHDGEFGSDCGRCHSADSFSNVRSIR